MREPNPIVVIVLKILFYLAALVGNFFIWQDELMSARNLSTVIFVICIFYILVIGVVDIVVYRKHNEIDWQAVKLFITNVVYFLGLVFFFVHVIRCYYDNVGEAHNLVIYMVGLSICLFGWARTFFVGRDKVEILFRK